MDACSQQRYSTTIGQFETIAFAMPTLPNLLDRDRLLGSRG